LAALGEVTPARPAAETDVVTHGRAHLAATVNRHEPDAAVLEDVRADEALVVWLDLAIAQAAGLAHRGRRLISVVDNRSIPALAEETRRGRTTPWSGYAGIFVTRPSRKS
jgi:hypothetical protein